MSQSYKNDSIPQITINHNKIIVLDVHVSAVLEYLDGLFSRGVINELDEITECYDGLIETVLNDELNGDNAIAIKRQINLLRETIFLFKGLLTKHRGPKKNSLDIGG